MSSALGPLRHSTRAACGLLVLCVALEAPTHPLAAQSTSGTKGGRGAASPPFALTHVSVVDVESGKVSPEVTVVVVGNRIAAVGLNARIPRDARVIDARGKVLLPGLWDMHSHSLDRWEWSSLLNVANGVTGIRDPGAVKKTQEIVELRRAVERGDTLGPRFVASGTIIDGSPKSRATYVAIDSPTAMRAEMRAEMQQRQAAGLDFIKVYTRLARDVFLAAAEEGAGRSTRCSSRSSTP